MNQILHIFKKDAVRHWPEILISLILLSFSTRHELLYPWQNSRALYSPSTTFSSLASRYITPATILFWVFLCVRVVQDESLVGDRQWWVTKPYEWWTLLCLKPFHAPGLMATFDAQKFPCTGEEPSGSVQEDVVSHAWQFTSHDGFPEPHYTPISDYSIWFRPPSLLSDLDNKPQLKIKSVIPCPGSEIRLARPELKRQVRIELDVPNVRLEDFVEIGGEYTVARKNSY